MILVEFFNLTGLVGEGDFLLLFLLLFVIVNLVSVGLVLLFLPGVLLGGEGDFDLLFFDLTALPVMTRSELLTDLSPLQPNT